jgi:hypothetical protein
MSSDALAILDMLDLFLLCFSVSSLTVAILIFQHMRVKLREHQELVESTRGLLEHFKRVAGEAQDAHTQWVGEIQKLKDKVTAMSLTLKR